MKKNINSSEVLGWETLVNDPKFSYINGIINILTMVVVMKFSNLLEQIYKNA